MSKILNGEVLGPDQDEKKTAEKVKGKFWPTFRKAARYIPFADDLVAAYFCALDPASPTRVRVVLLGALAYFIMPFDAVPDLIAGLGFTDDVGVLVAAIATVGAYITPEHRDKARAALSEDGQP